jgi:hypothetical protein
MDKLEEMNKTFPNSKQEAKHVYIVVFKERTYGTFYILSYIYLTEDKCCQSQCFELCIVLFCYCCTGDTL